MDVPKIRGRGRGRGQQSAPAETPKIVQSTLVSDFSKISIQQPNISEKNGSSTNGGAVNRPLTRGGLNSRPSRFMKFSEPNFLQENLPNLENRHGKSGQTISVYTNFVGFQKIPNTNIIGYDCNFDSGIKAKLVVDRYKLLKTLQYRGNLKSLPVAYDGRLVYSLGSLFSEDFAHLDITDPEHINTSRGVSGKLSFRKVLEVAPNSEQFYRVINVIFNLAQQILGQRKFGDDFFVAPSSDLKLATFGDLRTETFLPSRLKLRDQYEVLQGYRASLQRALQPSGSVMPIMHISSIHRLASLNSCAVFIAQNPRQASLQLPGRTVLTRHNNRSYQVSDILNNMSIDTQFHSQDKSISYRDYFFRRYGIQFMFDNQAFLKLKLKRVDRLKQMRIRRMMNKAPAPGADGDTEQEILIPAELCYLAGFSDEEKTAFQRDRDFNTICRKAPEMRGLDVTRFLQFLGSQADSSSLIRDWQIETAKEPIKVAARVLEVCFEPRSRFRDTASIDNKSVRPIRPRERTSSQLILGCHALGRVRPDMMQSYVRAVQEQAQRMGFEFCPVIVQARSINEAILDAKNRRVDILLLIVDDASKYREIKTTAIEQGILTQVVRQPTAAKPMTAQKVALQMAVKCGYAGWQLNAALAGPLLSTGAIDSMVVGIDVFTGKGLNAVQAAVFSLDVDCSRFYTHVSYAQGRNFELQAGNLAAGMREALLAYRRRNNRLPSRILVYRDGVGDNQLEMLQESEVKPLMECLNSEFKTDNKPFQLVFTVIKKRINQRFFLTDRGGRFCNVRPGTVIDSGITKPNWFEYYIVPQDAAQGTATPTNFNVVFNNAARPSDKFYMSADELQRSTFALTHLYFNWTGTIRVPAPVQYAHKCAFLLGQCAINSAINMNIRQNLFYL